MDGGEVAGCECEYRDGGFEDGGEGLHAVGDGCDDDVGVGRGDLGGVGCPRVMQDGEIAVGELWKGVKAVLRNGAEMVCASEGVEGDGDGRLKRSDAHAGVILCGSGFALCSLMMD